MKKIGFILLLIFTLQLGAQEQTNWITDYTIALNKSKNQNKPILAFVTNNEESEALHMLNKIFFSTEAFKTIANKTILLKLDVSNKKSYNVRLGIHYTKQTTALGLALVNENNDVIGEPLTTITIKNINSFITLVNSKL